MSYVGNQPNFQQFAVDTFNGGGASHTLTYTPGSATAILVFVDGVHQKPTTDYTVSGTTLTPVTAWPSGTNNVVVLYLGRSADVPTPADNSVTSAKLATTAITGQTEDTAPNLAADYSLVWDASAAALKKVLLGRSAGPVSSTVQASTSGTSIDFTGIPSWVKRITIQFVGVSSNGTSNKLIQIGDSGGIEVTGYLGGGVSAIFGAATAGNNYTAGFGIPSGSATNIMHGNIVLTLQDASTFTWTAAGVICLSDAAVAFMVAGSKSLSATLDRVRITTVNGTDAFSAGSINILYE